MGGQSLHDRQPGWAEHLLQDYAFPRDQLASEHSGSLPVFFPLNVLGSPYHPLGHWAKSVELINHITVTFPAQDPKEAARAPNPSFELCFHWILKENGSKSQKATPTNPGKDQ